MTFADKVVVMHDGQVLQTGAPEDLYENPAHTFVGYFIGSPGMNFFSCNIDGNRALIGDHKIVLDDKTCALAQSFDNRFKMGIRPMYIQLKKTAVENSIPVKVLDIKDHGNCRIVSVVFGQNRAMIRIPEDQPVPLNDAWIYFPPEKTKLYSNDSLLF
jgi:glycerol transport system ATP-binding protein